MNNIAPVQPTGRRHPSAHYIALLVPSEIGEWRVLFPDIAECEAHGFTIQDATYAATTALARCANQKRPHLPPPRSLVQIERDQEWFERNGIELARAVVTMVPLWQAPEDSVDEKSSAID